MGETSQTDQELLYYVSGPNCAGGFTLVKVKGRWKLQNCAPYLRKVIGRTEVTKIGEFLTAKGYRVDRIMTEEEKANADQR